VVNSPCNRGEQPLHGYSSWSIDCCGGGEALGHGCRGSIYLTEECRTALSAVPRILVIVPLSRTVCVALLKSLSGNRGRAVVHRNVVMSCHWGSVGGQSCSLCLQWMDVWNAVQVRFEAIVGLTHPVPEGGVSKQY
jgi:hypothetical protein